MNEVKCIPVLVDIQVSTAVVLSADDVQPPGVRWWIILLAIIAGILLLLLLILLMWKVRLLQ